MGLVRVSENEALARYKRAETIIQEYETERGFRLPEPWRPAITKLLLNGLSDPELHLIFDTLMRVEYEAGRLPPPPDPDYSAFIDKK